MPAATLSQLHTYPHSPCPRCWAGTLPAGFLLCQRFPNRFCLDSVGERGASSLPSRPQCWEHTKTEFLNSGSSNDFPHIPRVHSPPPQRARTLSPEAESQPCWLLPQAPGVTSLKGPGSQLHRALPPSPSPCSSSPKGAGTWQWVSLLP